MWKAFQWQKRNQFQACNENVRGDRRLNVRLISDELGFNRNSIWQITTEDLGMGKVCAKMVPARWLHTWNHSQHSHFLL